MFRTVRTAVLALALVSVGATTGIAASPATRLAAPAAAGQTAPVDAPVQFQAPAQAVQLSAAEMNTVQGDGIWSKIKKWFKKNWKKIVGFFLELIGQELQQTTESAPSAYDGGETLEVVDDHVTEYASQADYDAGVASSQYVDYGAWQQTEVWYGGGGCGGGGGDDRGGYYMDRQVESCY